MNNDLEIARAELQRAEAERNAAYWTFTRCAKGKPVPRELTRKVYELRAKLELLLNGFSA